MTGIDARVKWLLRHMSAATLAQIMGVAPFTVARWLRAKAIAIDNAERLEVLHQGLLRVSEIDHNAMPRMLRHYAGRLAKAEAQDLARLLDKMAREAKRAGCARCAGHPEATAWPAARMA